MITHKCTYLDPVNEIVIINEFERTSKDPPQPALLGVTSSLRTLVLLQVTT